MKTIIINSKKYGQNLVLVSDEDYEWLIGLKWTIHKNKNRNVAYVMTQIDGKTKYMHRLILALTETTITIDHIDGNGLNNQRTNLRQATYSENNINKGNRKNSSSKYKGVHLDKCTNKWRAGICINGKGIKLGRFINECDAALAYNNAALKLHGQFAYLNKIY